MVIRRTAAAPPPGVNFGDLAFYVGGFTLPEGEYALGFDVRMHAYTKQDGTKGVERLGVMVAAYPLEGGEPSEQFYSMGSKAHLSFAPNPDTGKGVVPIPGGPATSMPPSSNWGVLLKSLYDCRLPVGVFTNDLTVLDGLWAHTRNVPEPEERKGFASATGEAEQPQRSGIISIVGEILEGGKPWEGGGGFPEEAAAPAAPKPRADAAAGKKPALVPPKPAAARTAPARPAARTTTRPAPAAAPEPEGEEADENQIMEAALAGVSSVLEKNGNEAGITKLLLRTGTFKAVTAAAGGDMAQAVMETFFGSDASLNAVLGQVGYVASGTQIKPA